MPACVQRRGWDSNPRSFRSQTFQVCALSQTRRPLHDKAIVSWPSAERAGFEPARLSPTAFRERHHQPLGHLSASKSKLRCSTEAPPPCVWFAEEAVMAVQTRARVTKGKAKNIDACADDGGIIRAAAMDQRGSLMREIGKQGGAATPESLTEFKTAVTRALTPYASAILMDPEYGLPALKAKAPNAGVLLAYEKSGYDADPENRIPDVLDRWTVRRLVHAGADGIKVLIYYDPFDDRELNDRKEAVIERIGAECTAYDVPLFVEPLAYRTGMDEKGLEFAKKKPEAVAAYMAKFSEARFGIDILKVEVPVNMAFVQGSRANTTGQVAYTKADALRHYREAADAATKPFIYL